ncbi:MAG: hypothetical protein ACE5F8_01000 [Woeseiaceae bacterium]
MQTQALGIKRYRRPGALAWLVLFALAMFQVAVAAHDTQHSIADIADSCEMCVQLDDGGNALTGSAERATPIENGAIVRPLASLSADPAPVRPAQSRAPPRG